MSEEKKRPLPPYATYKSFSNLISRLRESGVPTHITRSMLPGSNSGKAAMSATLTSLGLVNSDDEPTPLMLQLSDAENDFGETLKGVLEASYDFLRDGSLDIANTTTEKVVEKFKALGAGGSTINKCMAFFLAAAQDADITVSQYVKTPPAAPKAIKKRPSRPAAAEVSLDDKDLEEGGAQDLTRGLGGKERIVVSVHGMDEWEIFVPKGLSSAQWKHGLKMAKFILDNYRPAEGMDEMEEAE